MPRPPSSAVAGAARLVLEGRAAAPGTACGPLTRNDPRLAPDEVRGGILVAERAVPEDVGRILASAGTLTLGGALLSHVSLLSREFGKPSVSLGPAARVRLVTGRGDALLELGDVVGLSEAPTLDAGDIVLLDGDGGRLQVPGGTRRGIRRRVREVFVPLALYGSSHGDAAVLRAAVRALGPTPGDALPFAIEAALEYEVIPAGESRVAFLRALRRGSRRRAVVDAVARAVRDRAVARIEASCRGTIHDVASDDDPASVDRAVERLAAAIASPAGVLADLGEGSATREAAISAVERAARDRKVELRGRVRRDVEAALAVPEDALRHRTGGLFRLLRRARAAGLEATVVARLHERLTRQVAEERARAGSRLVVALDPDEGLRDRALVGGKAAGLLHVMPILPAGCRVPRGFVVTSAAYRLHLLGDTGERLREAVADSGAGEPAVSRRARAAILSAEVPAEVVAAIREASETLGAERLAVRSSATIEDGAAGSLAGQFDTYLGVPVGDEIVERVRWAWASLWNVRALRTLTASGQSPIAAAQAVLLQEFVPTRAAGVLFSRDPSGRPDALVVNAHWGLGEGISQGDSRGDVYWVRRSDGDLLAVEPGEDLTQIRIDPGRTGTIEAPLPASRRGVPCLGREQLSRLAALARALHEATGRSQDVEFGFDEDGALVVFQVRRVVAARTGAA